MFTFKVAAPEIVAAIKRSSEDLTRAVKEGLDEVIDELRKSNELRNREATALENLYGLLRRQSRPAKPAELVANLVEENMDTLKYAVSVAAPTDPDVESRKFTVAVDGVAGETKVLGSNATDLGVVEVPQGSKVKLTLVDVDDANNESAPLVFEFDALDTLPPSSPTGFAVTLTGEAEAAPPTQTPEVPAEPETPSAEPAPETPAE